MKIMGKECEYDTFGASVLLGFVVLAVTIREQSNPISSLENLLKEVNNCQLYFIPKYGKDESADPIQGSQSGV